MIYGNERKKKKKKAWWRGAPPQKRITMGGEEEPNENVESGKRGPCRDPHGRFHLRPGEDWGFKEPRNGARLT